MNSPLADGICCGEYGNGYYKGFLNGEPIPGFEGHDFKLSESKNFAAGDATFAPSFEPTTTFAPSVAPTKEASISPTDGPSPSPTDAPSPSPTDAPSPSPTDVPSPSPTDDPSPSPTSAPSQSPTNAPSQSPTNAPSPSPSDAPSSSTSPSDAPSPSPTDAPSPSPSTAADRCESEEELFLLEIQTDHFPQESSWVLSKDSVIGNVILASESNFTSSSTNYKIPICLARNETYSLEMKDNMGDGICCQYGEGWYSFSMNGEEMKTGGDFTHYDVTTFTI